MECHNQTGMRKTQKEAMLEHVAANPGCTTKQFALAHYGAKAQQPMVNESARRLEREGKIVRRKDGKAYRLYLAGDDQNAGRQGAKPGLDELLRLDFAHAGWWEVSGQKPKCKLHRHAKEPSAIYAFIVDREVMYVGKTSRTVHDRMINYEQTNSTRSTTFRCNSHIASVLASGGRVDVYVLPDRAGLEYMGHRVCLADGLEPTLIAHFRPAWNGRM